MDLFLLYFIGRAFYKLAEKHGKHRWGYAILGVISYYAGAAIFGFILALLIDLGLVSWQLYDMDELALSLLALPAGLLTCWGAYAITKRVLSRQATANAELHDILDQAGEA
ncbi:MAG: hypothetical protein AAGB22_12390 [Bacteroidota bacterium]